MGGARWNFVHLEALTGKPEIAQAFNTLSRLLNSGARVLSRDIGWQGGHEHLKVAWHSEFGIWANVRPADERGRSWAWFGVEDPTARQTLSITCEINIPVEGIDRRVSGAFARNREGRVFLTHTGKVGGGRKGIGKRAFLEYFGHGQNVPIEWADGKRSETIPIASLDSPQFLLEVATFVHEVSRFKAQPSGSTEGASVASSNVFFPEFEGPRRTYSPRGDVEAVVTHGVVVNRLRDELSQRGWSVANDRARDLYVLDEHNRVSHLFEVKTDTSPTSMYTATGQLMLHGAIDDAPKRIMVLPTNPDAPTLERLRRLGIRVVTYDLSSNRVAFNGLD